MYCQLSFCLNGCHGGASLGVRDSASWFPGFTWCRRTAAPAGGWPRSRVFWRCRSSRCRWAGGDWASPLAAASPDGAPRSGPLGQSSPSPDAPIPGQRRWIIRYYWTNKLLSTSKLLILNLSGFFCYHFWKPWLEVVQWSWLLKSGWY